VHVKWFVIAAALLVASVRYLTPERDPLTQMPRCPERTRRGFLEERLRLLARAEIEIDRMVTRLDDDTLSERDRAATWDTLQQRRMLWQTWDTRYTPWVLCTPSCRP